MKEAQGGSNKGSSYMDLLNALYDQSTSADSFNSLQQGMAAGSRGNTGRRAI
jgi:hypothetical protein